VRVQWQASMVSPPREKIKLKWTYGLHTRYKLHIMHFILSEKPKMHELKIKHILFVARSDARLGVFLTAHLEGNNPCPHH
jgi:hypothetical protein